MFYVLKKDKVTEPNIYFESDKGGYIGVEHSFDNSTTAFVGTNVNDELKPIHKIS
jgi:hypothetical protein